MKKLINAPDDVVAEALRGMAAAHPSLDVDVESKVIVRAGGPTAGQGGPRVRWRFRARAAARRLRRLRHARRRVPRRGLHLTGPDQMLAATKKVDGGAGVLHIVKNYTGDVLNFQMAAELASDDGIEVVPVVVNDDVAVQDSLYTAGRRGTGATVFVEKIAGALAEQHKELKAVADVAREVNERTPVLRGRTHGVHDTGVRAARLRPARRRDRARRRHPRRAGSGARRRIASAAEIVDFSLDAIHDDMPLRGRAAVLVNGMGGTPLVELYVVFDEVRRYVEANGATIARSLVGNYITSLDMAGASITVLRLTPDLTALWDAPVETPALRWGR